MPDKNSTTVTLAYASGEQPRKGDRVRFDLDGSEGTVQNDYPAGGFCYVTWDDGSTTRCLAAGLWLLARPVYLDADGIRVLRACAAGVEYGSSTAANLVHHFVARYDGAASQVEGGR